MAKGFHFLARHGDRVGEHLVARASAWRNFTPHSTMQRCCRGEREYRVEYSCHRLKDFLTLITFHALNFVSALKSRLFSWKNYYVFFMTCCNQFPIFQFTFKLSYRLSRSESHSRKRRIIQFDEEFFWLFLKKLFPTNFQLLNCSEFCKSPICAQIFIIKKKVKFEPDKSGAQNPAINFHAHSILWFYKIYLFNDFLITWTDLPF